MPPSRGSVNRYGDGDDAFILIFFILFYFFLISLGHLLLCALALIPAHIHNKSWLD